MDPMDDGDVGGDVGVGGPLDLEAALEDGVRKNRRLVIILFFFRFLH